ncbi:MAG: FtsK/SpoIIIE domain-containing protein, partial [Muribaculaceae bacterium]
RNVPASRHGFSMLVAGATGQGKSVGLNAIITSLIYRKHPAELKFVLIDPKMVEFSLYSKLEHHYLAKLPGEEDAIITDPQKVIATLNSLAIEMDNRYSLLKDAQVRNIKEYNAKFVNHRLNPEKGHRFLPYIVVIVDEFCDLIMMAGKEVEMPIARIAQKARAIGIHMIIATQRPSTNVITGIIKANFPGRIAFRVTQMVDSRTILDCTGAQQLIGRGDMLFLANGEMDRIQCAFIDTPEVEAICAHIDTQIGYEEAYQLPEYIANQDGENAGMGGIADRDPLFEEAAAFIVAGQTASTSSLQRRYSIGYNRAGKIMDQMEASGIVGPAQGGKPRQVLIDSIQLSQKLEE